LHATSEIHSEKYIHHIITPSQTSSKHLNTKTELKTSNILLKHKKS